MRVGKDMWKNRKWGISWSCHFRCPVSTVTVAAHLFSISAQMNKMPHFIFWDVDSDTHQVTKWLKIHHLLAVINGEMDVVIILCLTLVLGMLLSWKTEDTSRPCSSWASLRKQSQPHKAGKDSLKGPEWHFKVTFEDKWICREITEANGETVGNQTHWKHSPAGGRIIYFLFQETKRQFS